VFFKKKNQAIMMEEAEGGIEDELEVSAAAMVYLASIPYSTRITIVKKGVLMKKGTGLVYRPWRRRMIIVDSQNRLSYFNGEILKGIFNVNAFRHHLHVFKCLISFARVYANKNYYKHH